MKLINGQNINLNEDCAVMLGKFDGMHKGHRMLLDEVLARKKEGLASLVFTFSVPPAELITGERGRLLMTGEEKRAYFERCGADYLFEFTFDDTARRMGAEDFVRNVICQKLHARMVVVGEDFCFGYNRLGNVDLLMSLSGELGYELCVKEKLKDEDGLVISSTRIIEAVKKGDMMTAKRLLGRPFSFTGEVVHGEGKGFKLGYPTVNISFPKEKCIPPRGVYASRVRIGDKIYLGATDIGVKPTLGCGYKENTETFLLDFSGDLYGDKPEIMLCEYLRGEKRFDSTKELAEQIGQDVKNIKRILS